MLVKIETHVCNLRDKKGYLDYWLADLRGAGKTINATAAVASDYLGSKNKVFSPNTHFVDARSDFTAHWLGLGLGLEYAIEAVHDHFYKIYGVGDLNEYRT